MLNNHQVACKTCIQCIQLAKNHVHRDEPCRLSNDVILCNLFPFFFSIRVFSIFFSFFFFFLSHTYFKPRNRKATKIADSHCFQDLRIMQNVQSTRVHRCNFVRRSLTRMRMETDACARHRAR